MTSDISPLSSPTRLIIGAGSHVTLGNIVREYQCDRLFIAVDAAVQGSAFFSSVKDVLAAQSIQSYVFAELEPNPNVETVQRAYAACQSWGAKAILAVGGGSTIDVAKAVAILATNGGRIGDYEGAERFSARPLPRIAIPTTAGTGSEVSGSCVITDMKSGLKMSIRHAAFNPADVAILDPLSLVTMPAHVAVHAGMDAFVHGFESFISSQADFMTDALNVEALRLISTSIRGFVADRTNLDAGLGMLCGSALAGIAFSRTGLGNVHCMSRFIGAMFHVTHGLANAVCLPVVAAFNMPASGAKYARVAQAMGYQTHGMSTTQAARVALLAIGDLCADLEVPARLRDVGVLPDRIEELATLCAEANYNRWNPRHTTLQDFHDLLLEAY